MTQTTNTHPATCRCLTCELGLTHPAATTCPAPYCILPGDHRGGHRVTA